MIDTQAERFVLGLRNTEAATNTPKLEDEFQDIETLPPELLTVVE